MNELKSKYNIFLITGIFFLLNLIQSLLTPVSEDEAYYWVWSQNLAWGYFDHPPMIAWWVAAGYKLFGGILGIRLFTVLTGSIGLFILWEILDVKTKYQTTLFLIFAGSTVVIQLFGFISTPDSPLLFFCLLYLYALKRFFEKSTILNVFVLAFSMATVMYSKYHGLLLIVFSVLPLLPKLLKDLKFYLAVLVSLILYLPHLFWMYNHDFVPIRYHFSERNQGVHFEWDRALLYFVYYFLGMSPLISYFVIKSLVKFKPINEFQKCVLSLAILPGVFFMLSLFNNKVQPQWLLISFVAMVIICYQFYAGLEEKKWLLGLGFGGILLIMILRVVLILPLTSPLYANQKFGEELKKRNLDNVVFEKYQEASVFLFFNPEKKAAVHRTLGNRENQYSLWGWEDRFYQKTVQYVSPWVRSDNSFVAYKNRNYYIKEIKNYLSYNNLKINTVESFNGSVNQEVSLKLDIYNGHLHSLTIGGNSELKLNISYYHDKQYAIEYSTEIAVDKFILQPGENKSLSVSFKNAPVAGSFNANIGIYYTQLGTTYFSEPIKVKVQ